MRTVTVQTKERALVWWVRALFGPAAGSSRAVMQLI